MENVLTFLQAIAAHPADEANRRIFADWLEERGDWRAEYLRLDHTLSTMNGEEDGFADLKARWQELRSRLSPGWLIVLGRSAVENCELRMTRLCPQRWEELNPTKTASVRFCEVCRKEVYYCTSIDEARDHAAFKSHCVAVDAGLTRRPGDLDLSVVMGLIDFGASGTTAGQ